MRTLFDDPPAQEHSPTSVAAAEAIKPDANRLRAMVYEAIRGAEDGLTDEETQDLLKLGGNTVRPRRRELQLAGKVIDSGKTRKTASGRSAVVWTAVVMPTATEGVL